MSRPEQPRHLAEIEISTEMPKDPAGHADAPGWYVVVGAGARVNDGRKLNDRMVAELRPGTRVEVLEVIALHSAMRVRGRIANPPGWISLVDMKDGFRFAQKDEKATRRAAKAAATASERRPSALEAGAVGRPVGASAAAVAPPEAPSLQRAADPGARPLHEPESTAQDGGAAKTTAIASGYGPVPPEAEGSLLAASSPAAAVACPVAPGRAATQDALAQGTTVTASGYGPAALGADAHAPPGGPPSSAVGSGSEPMKSGSTTVPELEATMASRAGRRPRACTGDSLSWLEKEPLGSLASGAPLVAEQALEAPPWAGVEEVSAFPPVCAGSGACAGSMCAGVGGVALCRREPKRANKVPRALESEEATARWLPFLIPEGCVPQKLSTTDWLGQALVATGAATCDGQASPHGHDVPSELCSHLPSELSALEADNQRLREEVGRQDVEVQRLAGQMAQLETQLAEVTERQHAVPALRWPLSLLCTSARQGAEQEQVPAPSPKRAALLRWPRARPQAAAP